MYGRIKELAEQAGFYVADDKIYIPTTSEDITACQTKFAELIIQKCAAVVQFLQDHGCEEIADDLKKHFGVE